MECENKALVFSVNRHRMACDGEGITTLVGFFGCPLKCKYCLNPQSWDETRRVYCKEFTPEELYEKVKIDNLYFQATGGGITFGGGEPLLYASFIKEFASLCPKEWHINVETSLNVSPEQVELLMPIVDEFIVDIKDMNSDTYESYTGYFNELVLKNLESLKSIKEKVLIRVPLIDDYNNQDDVNASIACLQHIGYDNITQVKYLKNEQIEVERRKFR